jgi:hypothetical protein
VKAYPIILLLLIATWISSCTKDESTANLSLPPPGSYFYVSYDSLGVRIVVGWFTLLIADSAHIAGEWHFTQVGGGSSIGPQVGDGNLVGGFSSGLLWIELNPQYRDNNLQLIGTFTSSTYTGTWLAIGIMGVHNHGSFRASRN